MNADQNAYLTKLVSERATLLSRFIKVEQHLAEEGDFSALSGSTEAVAEARETAARRAQEYRDELALAETVLADLRKVERASS